MAPPILIDAVGTLAGIASMSSFVPQVIKIWRERDASAVSLRMFAVTATAFVLWTTFGLLQNSWPITVSNAVCLVLVLTIVALRLKFGDGGSEAESKSPGTSKPERSAI